VETILNIALIAHDAKKELMTQFCIAYCGTLSKHSLCATGTTGKMVSEATGLNIVKFLCGYQGGEEQISARIACNEIDLLLFFRDPLTARKDEPNEANLLRLCDVQKIPLATNASSAVIMLEALKNGTFLTR
jgi:methylglyoxal synthase